jgi:3-methyl-2-oxobutanoate hydroxymethyltransferase
MVTKMAAATKSKTITAPDIIEMKRRGEKIAVLTAYDFVFASLLDQAGIDIVLVGDSAAMVFAGHTTTLPMTMEQALYHCTVVRRGVQHALLVADMPFLSFQVDARRGFENAGRFFKEALVDAVKLEGGERVAETIKKIVDAGMPVMGHLGLTPQSVHQFGGYKLQAATEKAAQRLMQDALILEQAGVFSIVLEKIPHLVAKDISEKLTIPTIGIGAGFYCDGQVLVTHDMLGLFEKFKPSFVRRYAECAIEIRAAFQNYIHDVKQGNFPSSEESF